MVEGDSELCVFVDDREPQSMLMNMDIVGLDYDRKRMITGDYVCGDVCIERKTVDDMCGSIVDGRMKRQVARMKEKYKWNYVLVSGRISDRKSEVHENCILGKMASLLVSEGVPVLCVDDDVQLTYLMKRIFERHMKDVNKMSKTDSNDAFCADWIQEVWDKGFGQVQKELYDYWHLMDIHSKLLDRVTNGKMSKTNYTWEAIEGVLNEIDAEVLEGEA